MKNEDTTEELKETTVSSSEREKGKEKKLKQIHSKVLKQEEDGPAANRYALIKTHDPEDVVNTTMIVRFFSDLGEIIWFENLDKLKDRIYSHPMEFVQDCR